MPPLSAPNAHVSRAASLAGARSAPPLWLVGVTGSESERDAAVRMVALHGWTVARETKRGYLIMRCACGQHQETLHKTTE